MHISLGILGHTLTFEITLTPDADIDNTYEGIRGGSGGLYERCIDEPLEYIEGEPWEEEERHRGFGFR